MKIPNLVWAIPMLGMLAMPALAGHGHHGHYNDSRFERRLDRQHARIKQGIRSGELTRREAKRLRRQQRHISNLEHDFARDGYLDRRERRTLRRELDTASDRIYRLKHNDRYRDRRATTYYRPHRRYQDDAGWAVRLNIWDYL